LAAVKKRVNLVTDAGDRGRRFAPALALRASLK